MGSSAKAYEAPICNKMANLVECHIRKKLEIKGCHGNPRGLSQRDKQGVGEGKEGHEKYKRKGEGRGRGRLDGSHRETHTHCQHYFSLPGL